MRFHWFPIIITNATSSMMLEEPRVHELVEHSHNDTNLKFHLYHEWHFSNKTDKFL